MATGISIHIGLNQVDSSHYGGWDGTLLACEFDANDMAGIARKQGFQAPHVFLTRHATSDAVLGAISDASKTLKAGDILLVTYSGHGGQLPDTNYDETDRYDETWVLYDREVPDDELYFLWSTFRQGVRIFVLSDSCHSGTVTKMQEYVSRDQAVRLRAMPPNIQLTTYEHNQTLYNDLQSKFAQGRAVDIKATGLLISGCQDWQLSSDGSRNGLFTGILREVWSNNSFEGSYVKFHEEIYKRMPREQKPNYYKIGPPSADFEAQRPFTIDAKPKEQAAALPLKSGEYKAWVAGATFKEIDDVRGRAAPPLRTDGRRAKGVDSLDGPGAGYLTPQIDRGEQREGTRIPVGSADYERWRSRATFGGINDVGGRGAPSLARRDA